ncbi:AFG2-interacting ribosome maturation factor isoform X1 [Pithys albifrons albifrons]|uniref:AFG2-interacting ribosome maturation factor isoform X1 n=1 Tax=Pithys albifrons albifrons TaxID=3385563 RepID=UPI003A5CE72D
MCPASLSVPISLSGVSGLSIPIPLRCVRPLSLSRFLSPVCPVSQSRFLSSVSGLSLCPDFSLRCVRSLNPDSSPMCPASLSVPISLSGVSDLSIPIPLRCVRPLSLSRFLSPVCPVSQSRSLSGLPAPCQARPRARSNQPPRPQRPMSARRGAMTHTGTAAMAAMAEVAAALRVWLAAVGADRAGRAALSAWTPLLGSLAALAAQMRAARRLPWDAAPLGAFPELRERLWRKQRGAAEALLEQLGGRRTELREVRDAAGAAAAAVLRVYEERAAELGLEGALRRGPRCPSLADVLEGLQDVERHYRHLYLESKLLLQHLSCDSLADMEALPQAWERILERHREDVVKDTLLRVSLFVENYQELSCSSGS